MPNSPFSTAQNTYLVSIYLPPDFSVIEIANKLNFPLKRGIEATHYAELDNNRWLFFCQFDVLTFVNWSREQIIATLQTLEINNAADFEHALLYQDYNITVDRELNSEFQIDNETITLKELSRANLMIVVLVIAQSVGLEHFEQEVGRYYDKGRNLLENSGRFSWLYRKQFSDYAKEISLLRHDMVLDLMLLDKPDILWDDQPLERLYNQLAELLELQARFDIISYKLNTLKEDIAMMMDLYHHKHSSFLEWIIILLILIEIIMGIGEHFSLF